MIDQSLDCVLIGSPAIGLSATWVQFIRRPAATETVARGLDGVGGGFRLVNGQRVRHRPPISGSADGTGTAARFDRPLGAAIDGKDLYVSESRKIRKIDIDTGAVTTLAGSDEAGFSDGAGKTASFWQPNGLAMSSKSPRRLFVADSSSNLIREIR